MKTSFNFFAFIMFKHATLCQIFNEKTHKTMLLARGCDFDLRLGRWYYIACGV